MRRCFDAMLDRVAQHLPEQIEQRADPGIGNVFQAHHDQADILAVLGGEIFTHLLQGGGEFGLRALR